MSRTCAVVDSIDCEASAEGLATGPVVTCWACGDDAYRWRGQFRRMRFCFNYQNLHNINQNKKREFA